MQFVKIFKRFLFLNSHLLSFCTQGRHFRDEVDIVTRSMEKHFIPYHFTPSHFDSIWYSIGMRWDVRCELTATAKFGSTNVVRFSIEFCLILSIQWQRLKVKPKKEKKNGNIEKKGNIPRGIASVKVFHYADIEKVHRWTWQWLKTRTRIWL